MEELEEDKNGLQFWSLKLSKFSKAKTVLALYSFSKTFDIKLGKIFL